MFADDYALPLKEPDWTEFERLGYETECREKLAFLVCAFSRLSSPVHDL